MYKIHKLLYVLQITQNSHVTLIPEGFIHVQGEPHLHHKGYFYSASELRLALDLLAGSED